MAELTEAQVIRALNRLSKAWPKHLWLFAAGHDLCLMRKNEDGSLMTYGEGMGMEHAAIIETFSGISSGGGDW